MIDALNKKLLRDLRHMRGQVFATALVVACGVATFVAMQSTYNSLVSSRDAYYSLFRFADVFASLKRAPEFCGVGNTRNSRCRRRPDARRRENNARSARSARTGAGTDHFPARDSHGNFERSAFSARAFYRTE
jgi:hypothetical protein